MAQKKPAEPARPDRYAAIVVDANSGKVLFEHDASQKLYPASTAKMMTAYIVFDALQRGTLKTDQILTVSRNAAMQPRTNLAMMSSSKDRKGRVSLRQNTTKITVENAIRGMLTHSANDAAVVLAEAIGGSEAGFAEMMNAAAARLGMKDTHYTNPNGLPDTRQKTTVEDLALLNRALLREFPHYLPYFRTESFTFNNHTYNNTNKLLGAYPGLDMGKTGYIGAAGWNLAASAKQGDERVIGIVFGARTPAERKTDMEHL
ncbi:MAG TPA: D-alanyl-D-alanine carboxypeptidase family protein, partial [Patescibacteria group bacterium]|nr:D-alanyl-D-alanine carboxypeptidase family protein [Patescibacteria group bacterium]